jgi:hypothetical protein
MVALLFEHSAQYVAIDVKIGANADLIQSFLVAYYSLGLPVITKHKTPTN